MMSLPLSTGITALIPAIAGAENARLKRMDADMALQNTAMQDLIAKQKCSAD